MTRVVVQNFDSYSRFTAFLLFSMYVHHCALDPIKPIQILKQMDVHTIPNFEKLIGQSIFSATITARDIHCLASL